MDSCVKTLVECCAFYHRLFKQTLVMDGFVINGVSFRGFENSKVGRSLGKVSRESTE